MAPRPRPATTPSPARKPSNPQPAAGPEAPGPPEARSPPPATMLAEKPALVDQHIVATRSTDTTTRVRRSRPWLRVRPRAPRLITGSLHPRHRRSDSAWRWSVLPARRATSRSMASLLEPLLEVEPMQEDPTTDPHRRRPIARIAHPPHRGRRDADQLRCAVDRQQQRPEHLRRRRVRS